LLQAKSKVETAKLLEYINDLKKQIDEMKYELVKENISSKNEIIKSIDDAVENPDKSVDKVVNEIEGGASEIPEDERARIPSNERGSDVIENVEKTTEKQDSKLPNWLIPALIVGGTAYFLLRNKS
jgi:hypothetical protein